VVWFTCTGVELEALSSTGRLSLGLAAARCRASTSQRSAFATAPTLSFSRALTGMTGSDVTACGAASAGSTF